MRVQRSMVFRLLLLCCFCLPIFSVNAQSFLEKQLQYPTFKKAYQKDNNKLKKEFEKKGLTYPAKYIFIRSFKYDSKLEVWVKDKRTDTFSLFKSYPVCALSGYMGRKVYQGDYQVPEGFYYINGFNPKSAYHLALKINYPNFSDRLNGTADKDPGGGIYIHGSCVTVGCIPITDKQIEEVYLLAVMAKNAGQDYIPVHILPIDFNNKKSIDYLMKSSQTGDTVQSFWLKLKQAYDYFNSHHKLPIILYNEKGNYVVKKGRGVTPLKNNYSASDRDKKIIKEAILN